jgi:hypothetical protein
MTHFAIKRPPRQHDISEFHNEMKSSEISRKMIGFTRSPAAALTQLI